MGTVVTTTLYEKRPDIIEEIYDYLKQMDILFSANRDDSELYKVNSNAGIKPVKVNQETFSLIRDAVSYSKKYYDSFNVLIGPLVKLWSIGFGGDKVPEPTDINRLIPLVHPDDVELNETKTTVFLQRPGMQLDLGAIAKGYFADNIISFLKSKNIDSGIIDLGGNVKFLGKNPTSDNGLWSLGIQNPFHKRNEPILNVHTSAKTFVTSGISERYMIIDDQIYHHILSPETGYPIHNDVAQVTIITDNSEQAEILSTVCFFKGKNDGLNLIEQLPNVEAVYVDSNNVVFHSSGLKETEKGVLAYE